MNILTERSPIRPLEPPYCYAHSQKAPCMECLRIEIALLVNQSNKNNDAIIFFTDADSNSN
jgi:hypothetical protein